MVARDRDGLVGRGGGGLMATLVTRGPRPTRRTELGAPGVRPAALVAAAQFRESLLSRVASISSSEGPVPSALTGQGSTSRKETVSMVAAVLSLRATVSPELDRLPP